MPVQDFDEIVEKCKEEDVLWEDPYFTPSEESLYFSKKPEEEIVWKRPREICDDPQLFVDGESGRGVDTTALWSGTNKN